MEIETAFKLLDLPTSASPDEIKKAYRRLSRETHPDTEDGTDEGQVSLNGAYERALAYSRISDAVVPIGRDALARELRHIVGLGGANVREKARARLRRRNRPLQQLKWLAWIAGGVAGALAFAGENLGFLPWPEQDSASLERALASYAATFGAAGLTLQSLVSWNTRRLEAYVEKLASRRHCASELAEALAYADRSIVSEEDVRPGSARAVNSSPYDLPIPLSRFLLGPDDFGPALAAKAVEHGLLRPLDQEELTPDTAEKYQVLYRPSLFRFPPPPPAPAPTVADARTQAGCGAFGLLLTSAATFYLGVMKTSWWAVVPGVLIVSTAILMVSGFTEARRRALQEGDSDAIQEPKVGV